MSGTSIKKKNINDKDRINILNFKKGNSFFFKLTSLNSILNDISNINDINPTDSDINILSKEIQEIKESDKAKKDNNFINVIKIYANRIKDLVEIKQMNSENADRIKEIVDNYC